jgi:hypothetical protein
LNFGAVLGVVSAFLDEKGYRYAVIGGVALAIYGVTRTTQDLDLIVDLAGQNDLIGFLESLGYKTLHRSHGYSTHLHADPDRGRLDFVYVAPETGDKLFAGCHPRQGPGDIQVPVPRPEHLAALKVLSMKNDPDRTFQDLADIRALLVLPGVDRAEVRDYFERHGLKGHYDDLEKTL